MAYIHQRNLIHCDLTPGNILLENYHPKIGGFNFTISANPDLRYKSQENGWFSLYRAPELFSGSEYTNKIDVYSYSIILYNLLALKDPFYQFKNKFNSFQLSNIVKEGQRPRFDGIEISDSFRDLINLCWHQDPDQRPSFKKILKGYIDHKNEIFNLDLINKEEFEKYIKEATKDLEIPNDDDIIYETLIAGIQP